MNNPPGKRRAIISGMKPQVARQLLDLNASFYQTFAPEFSATRQRLQPGVLRVVAGLILNSPQYHSILDLGCGNGALAVHLLRSGYTGSYLGLDFSPDLLTYAQNTLNGLAGGYPAGMITFKQANLADEDLKASLSSEPFDAILAFAALHHLPGRENRRRLLRLVKEHLAQGGRFIHSEWQFQRSPRWAGRRLPWEKAGLADGDVEAGDTLLDWRATGGKAAPALRYVHRFTEDELAEDARACGFRILETFYSDGKEGDLGLYQVWAAEE